jgi:hypothetical protein
MGTSTGAPTTDYVGKSRIGPVDIGTYEVQYSRWTGTSGTTWSTSTNWQGSLLPTSGASDVIVPSSVTNYPITSGTNFSIGSGNSLIIEAGAKATFDVLTNSSGTLRIRSNASGIGSLRFNSYTDGGSEEITMFLSGGGGPAYKWHYIAVPGSMNKSAFTNTNPYNLLLFDDSKITTGNNMEGWQWHDGYDGTTSFTTLNTKRGYNFYHTADVTVTLPTVTGLLSTMGASVPLQYNGNGLNLIGNSLTCSINWDNVTRSGNMRNAIYFTTNNEMVSYVNGVGSPIGTTGIIPPLQGFFVKALEAGCSLNFSPVNVRTHGTVNRYKGEPFIPLLRIELLKDGITNDETVIRFDYDATTDFDNLFDASKLFAATAPKARIWSVIGDEDYVINALPFPDTEYLLPLSLIVKEEGTHSIKKTEITGLENYTVELVDTYQDFTADLSATDQYIFASTAGTFTDRFYLKFIAIQTGLDDLEVTEKLVNIFIWDNSLNIQPVTERWSNLKTDIKVYDTMGRLIDLFSDKELYSGATIQLPFNEPKGVYIVEISSGNRRVVQKVSNR